MMKKKILKVLAIVGCAAILVAGSIAGTFAYLTFLTGTVTNTFTAGNVKITLDEAKVTEYGVAVDGANRVIENTYKLIPGHSYLKDPTIHVTKGSEVCYLFIKVENEISGIEGTNTVAAQLTANGWLKLDGQANVWYKAEPIDARQSANDVDVATFTSFTVNETATNADVDSYKGKTIKVTAYAIQADGFTTAAAAWSAAPTTWTTNSGSVDSQQN